MIGEKITIDFKRKKEYPKIIWKEETDSHIRYHLEFEDGKAYYADVINISTNGKYTLLVVDKI